MRLAIFGATGGIGRHVLAQAIAAGHEVAVLVRDPGKLTSVAADVRVVSGDITRREDVAAAISGCEAVISALGPTADAGQVGVFREWAHHLVACMQATGPPRLVLLSGAAVDVPGERKAVSDRIASMAVRLLAKHVVAAKQAEFDVIHGSLLDCIAARPPRVVDGPATGHIAAGLDLRLGPRSRISQPDLATFLLRQTTDDTWLRQAPFVTS